MKNHQQKMTTKVTFFTFPWRLRHLWHLKIRTELSSAFHKGLQVCKKKLEMWSLWWPSSLTKWNTFHREVLHFVIYISFINLLWSNQSSKLCPQVHINKHAWQEGMLVSEDAQIYLQLAALKHKVFILRRENGEVRKGKSALSFF